METKTVQIDISKAMSICLRNGIKVGPIVSGRKFKIEVKKQGETIVFDKEVSAKEINNALSRTYKYYALIILKEQHDANSTKES